MDNCPELVEGQLSSEALAKEGTNIKERSDNVIGDSAGASIREVLACLL